MEKYRCFTRTWWKENPNWPNGLEPKAGPKTYFYGEHTEEEARKICREYNREVDPGRLKLKMEFESC